MKMTTHVHAKLDNRGTPADSLQLEGTTREVLHKLVEWIAGVSMNNRLTIVIARNAADLEIGRRNGKQTDDELRAEFASMFAAIESEED